MSEEQNTGKPKPRLLAGTAATGASKPRLLAGSTEGLGKLKLAMTPEQAAAMERVKAERAAAEEAERARLEAEARYAEEQARYEEEKRLYEEYMAAEKLRQEEEARLAAEQQAVEAEQAAQARAALEEQARIEAEQQAAQEADQPQPDAPAATAPVAQDPASMAALAEQQLAAAQKLMAEVQAMQAAALQQAQTPAAEAPQPVEQSAPAPVAAPAPSTLRRPSAPIPMPSIPTPSITPQTAAPAIQPTSPLGGTKPLGAGIKTAKAGEEAPVKKPLWKRPVLYIPFAVAFLALGTVSVLQLQKRAAEQRIMDRYVAFAKMGADDSQTTIAALPEDAMFVLGKIKTDDNAWEAASSTIQKMMKGSPTLWPLVLKDLKDNYSSYLQKGSAQKLQRLVYFVATQKPAPEGLREGMIDFYNFAPPEYKEGLIYQIHPLFKDSDIPFLIGIINDGDASARLRGNAERTVSKVMSRATDKAALSKMIIDEYNKADENQKNVYIRLMGKTGDDFGLKFLDGLVNGKDTGNIARRNALKALGSWTNDDAIAVLLKVKDSPYGQDPATSGFVTEELYKCLVAPGRKRDMAKVKPLVDYLKTLNKTQMDKLTFIGHLKGNAKTDQWALDLLKEFYDDSDDKVSYQAEKAMETVNKRKAPEAPKPQEDEEAAAQ